MILQHNTVQVAPIWTTCDNLDSYVQVLSVHVYRKPAAENLAVSNAIAFKTSSG